MDKPPAIIFIYYGVVDFCTPHEVSYHIPMRPVGLTQKQVTKPQLLPPAKMGRSISVQVQSQHPVCAAAGLPWVRLATGKPFSYKCMPRLQTWQGPNEGLWDGKPSSLSAETKLKRTKRLFLQLLGIGVSQGAKSGLNRLWPVNSADVWSYMFYWFDFAWTAKVRGGDNGWDACIAGSFSDRTNVPMNRPDW